MAGNAAAAWQWAAEDPAAQQRKSAQPAEDPQAGNPGKIAELGRLEKLDSPGKPRKPGKLDHTGNLGKLDHTGNSGKLGRASKLGRAREALARAEASVGLTGSLVTPVGNLVMPTESAALPAETSMLHANLVPAAGSTVAGSTALPASGSRLPAGAPVPAETWDLPEELRVLFPRGLHRGMTIGTFGSRFATMFIASLASSQGAWCIYLGCADIGWAGAADLGIALDRTVSVPQISAAAAGKVAAAAVDGFDVVICGPGLNLDKRSRKALARRAGTRGAIIVGEGWKAQTSLTAQYVAATGLGRGRGHLRSLHLEMQARHGHKLRLRVDASGWQQEPGLRVVD
ncbi:hypothetical protein [Actinobaculum suis]|uniref:hypothetical protein n=1 Tax=Actinobaculum suis TaxID=1657 RepID=UPI0008087CEB|nr:hypothetical protein [Actinobaculum suis]OCA93714.1 hypothetical protein ACU20_07605 [Actinobaculum suis]OCA94007.1 hypothetical protein ACU21_07560 [Actinobaculum suis]